MIWICCRNNINGYTCKLNLSGVKNTILIFFIVGLLLSVQAQSDSTTIQLNEVVIHSNRIQTGFDQESASVIIIQAKDIASAPVISVPDVLRYYAGMDIRQRGANGVQADPGIRGSTFDQVLILVNGIKVSDPQSGHHTMNLPVDINNIERIEIIKGPAARIYGQNAFAGAINFITKSPEKNALSVQVTGGDFELWGGKMGGAFVGNKVSHYASISTDQSGGYQYNTDYSINNYFYQSKIKTRNGAFSILGGLTDRKFGANGFYASENFKDQYEEVQTSLVSVSYNSDNKGKWSVQPRIYWRRNKDDYIFIRANPAFYHNIHTGHTYGAEVNTTYNNKFGITGVGVDVNQVSLESSNLGNRERTVATLFLEQRFVFLQNKLDVTPGVQMNYYSDFGLNAFPGVNVGYAMHRSLKLFGNWGYTYRVPSFTDLYYSDPANLGNPNLIPEKAVSYELGLKLTGIQGLTGQLSYFARNGQDIIDWTRNVPSDPWQAGNISKVNMDGVEFNVSLLPNLVAGGNSPFQKLDLNYTFIANPDVTSGDAQFSRYALENLKHQFSAGLSIQYTKWLQQSVYFRYADRVSMEDYSVVDSRLSATMNKAGVFVDVTNIFDVKYKETNLVTLPGRWFKMGLSYQF
ncbi:MAG TPA: TonB-dependent receptor [Cytophagales bacterium]|nr:TonB-dependent receptor [Cytophagales bacterium]HCR54215.1 TonB-dependent receptor [Cytophagales bacterium]